ncbi:MAG TPA: alkaline phosphatase family protein [Acidisarcina sp.]|nr:alkaline phosphatase family protein [Acidisarcina sp.]
MMVPFSSWKQIASAAALGAMLLAAAHTPALADENESGASTEVKHVLVLSFDGLHAIDLANYIQSHPASAFADLARHGVRYSNASTSKPSDSFPGILAPLTGGSPNSTGVWYDDAYDRKYSPPLVDADGNPLGDKNCTVIGTEVVMDESIDKNMNAIDGGGGINEDRLPRDPANGCAPVYPWQYSRVNNVFEVVKAHGGLTAWSDKHVGAYTILYGPSGKGLDEYYSPEVAANNSIATSSVDECIKYDDLKRDAVLNWIRGYDYTGKNWVGVPTVFGSNFQEISVGQKVINGGYIDEIGTPSAELGKALAHADSDLGMFINALKTQGIYQNTAIILATKHGQSPIDKSRLQTRNTGVKVPGSFLGSTVAQETTDDISLIWLTDASQTETDADILQQNQAAIHAEKIYSGNTLQLMFNDPSKDSRTPDIIVQPELGVIYTKSTSKIAEHGGFSLDDTSIGLLVSYPGLAPRVIKEAVDTRQVAPTILRSLGLNPYELKAVQMESTPSLPGLSHLYH